MIKRKGMHLEMMGWIAREGDKEPSFLVKKTRKMIVKKQKPL